MAYRKEQARGTRRDTPGVLAIALPGAPTLRKAVAFEQRGGCKPLLRGDRGAGGGAWGALRDSVRQARAHPFLHPLPLVAEGSMITNAIQTDLVLHTICRTSFRGRLMNTPEKPLKACIAGSKRTKTRLPHSSVKLGLVNNPG